MLQTNTTALNAIPKTSVGVFFSFEKSKKPEGSSLHGAALEKAFAIAVQDGFTGKLGQVTPVRYPDLPYTKILFAGLGQNDNAALDHLRRASASVARFAESTAVKALYVRLPTFGTLEKSAQAAAEGAILGSYRYKQFKTVDVAPAKLGSVSFITKNESEKKSIAAGLNYGSVFAESVCFARDLINRPPSDTTPAMLVDAAKKAVGKNVKIRVFNKREIEKMNMGAILGVNRGSHQPPYFLHLTYKPTGAKAKKKIGICGKGITFDSGGLSLKPASSMETMKYDMSGAASVFAVFRALSTLKPAIEVHGFTPLTENMPGGNAVKPGDVLRTHKGKTIEVLNTDAEGRLVLADALSYACEQDLDEVLDIATLTGACVIALGNQIAGILGTNQPLIERLKDTAVQAGEKLWQLPLEKEYEALLRSTVADIKNIGPAGQAGTIMGALFLKEFVDKTPWAHLDIASTGWTSSTTALSEVGATGVMIRTLLNYIIHH